MNLARLKAELCRDEGLRLVAYRCTKGKLTIGVGRNLDDCPLTAEEIKVVGHDGRSKPISRGSALYLLDNGIKSTISDLNRAMPWWKTLDEVRRRALANMAFNLGLPRLLGFKKMLHWLEKGYYVSAAAEALDSKWSKQVGDRAIRIAAMIQTGKEPK